MGERPSSKAAQEPLGPALLPVVLHRLNNATQLLTGLNALLAMEGGEVTLEARGDDLATASRTVDELGWLVAVIASGSGADLLLERREPRGLSIVARHVADAARRAGHGVGEGPREVPTIAADVLDGWQLPWAIGALLVAASEDATGPFRWTLEPRDGAAVFGAPAGDAVHRLATLVLERLPGAELALGAGRQELALPGSWLRFGDGAE